MSCLTNSLVHWNTKVATFFYNQEFYVKTWISGFLWEIGRPVTLGRHSYSSFSGWWVVPGPVVGVGTLQLAPVTVQPNSDQMETL